MRPAHRLLQDLVRLPSVNPMGRPIDPAIHLEGRVTDYLERFFRDLGVPHERQPVETGRENIVARIDSAGATRTILWEVHQDTVPVDGMIVDPFGGVIDGRRLYGRGACDVKGGMAAMLAAFMRLVNEKPAGAANVVLACTVDEEATFLGVQALMRRGLRADFAIVAEPTQLRIVDAHKGVVRWLVQTEGRACHSSRPDQGINAIYRMGRVLAAIENYADTLMRFSSDSRLGPPTVSVGRIDGGVSVNVVPERCVIEVDRRLAPGEDATRAWEHFRDAITASAGVPVTCDPAWMACPALPNDTNGESVRRLGAAIDAVEGSHQVIAVPFGTDASTINLGGIPAVVFGPGDIAQAHTKDEWIDLDQLDRAVEILYRLAVTGD